MVRRLLSCWGVLGCVLCFAAAASAQQAGSIRGMVYDADFDAPLAAAQVTIVETGAKAVATDQGNYVFNEVPPGTYTIVFSKEGYNRQARTNVLVQAGQMTEVNASLSGEFEEMEEFVVQDVDIGGAGGSGTEAEVLQLRAEAPQLMDSVSSQEMSRIGASDAVEGLRAVAGASVQEGKYPVIRGLPDRYVNSQMNGVRLPSADAEKRAVQLDQFPSAVIESIQVSKTFTPDQQGDASGGAVNVVLKGIPDNLTFKFETSVKWNSSLGDHDQQNFLTWKNGKLGFLGRKTQPPPLYQVIGGAVGVIPDAVPTPNKWSMAGGGKLHFDIGFDNGLTLGAFGSLFYERDAHFYRNGINDSYWVAKPGDPMTPQYSQGTPDVAWDPKHPYNPVQTGDFKTSLFDVAQGSESVKWGGLGVLGAKTEHHELNLTYLFTRDATSKATLAENTRGKAYYFPGYQPDNASSPGNQHPTSSPYLRLETLEYTERTAKTLQLTGRHTLPIPRFGFDNVLTALPPEFDWAIASSSSEMYQPDKRLFGSMWYGPEYYKGFPPYLPSFTRPATYNQYKPTANFTVGNFQDIWKDVLETSDQYFWNAKLPFEQWTGDKGFVKFGVFNDKVHRLYTQQSFSNFSAPGSPAPSYIGGWDQSWSSVFTIEGDCNPVTAANIDDSYEGFQNIRAWYWMVDLPLFHSLKVIGGVRHETTDLKIVNFPESDVTYIPLGGSNQTKILAKDVNVDFHQKDTLPSLGVEYTLIEPLTFRASYSQTVARQTFKELTPIQQMEYLGGDVFVGNPELKMSALNNYDFRVDWTPFKAGLISASWFKKDIKNPIEYVQRNAGYTFTTPVNYPQGTLQGLEFEARQNWGGVHKSMSGWTSGFNATWIGSQVTLPEDESAAFDGPNVKAPMKTRDMTGAPAYLYNFYTTYDLESWGTQFSLFYTIRGDTLVAGAGHSSAGFVPSVYEKHYGTFNAGITQKLGKHFKLKLQAKNLTNPEIQTVYRSRYIGKDVVKTSYTKGVDLSVGIYAEFDF